MADQKMVTLLLANVRSIHQNAGCLVPIMQEHLPKFVGLIETWE